MNDFNMEHEKFRNLFELSREALTAMGDSNRQLIIRFLIENCGQGGVRVGEIQKNTNISRTAVSHHLKVLKDSGIVKMRREGTRNYYYMDSTGTSLMNMIEFWKQAETMISFCPYHRKKDEEK